MKKIVIVCMVFVAILLGVRQGFNKFTEYKATQQRHEASQVLRSQIVKSLKDPVTVQWRKELLSTDSKTLCGEVNAKNSLGGYVGFKRYIANHAGYLVEGAPFQSWYMDSNKTPVPDYMAQGAQLSDSGQQVMFARDVFNFFWTSNCTQ